MWIIFALAFRAISSVGSEHLPYKQGVVGSIPTSPTETEPRNIGAFSLSEGQMSEGQNVPIHFVIGIKSPPIAEPQSEV